MSFSTPSFFWRRSETASSSFSNDKCFFSGTFALPPFAARPGWPPLAALSMPGPLLSCRPNPMPLRVSETFPSMPSFRHVVTSLTAFPFLCQLLCPCGPCWSCTWLRGCVPCLHCGACAMPNFLCSGPPKAAMHHTNNVCSLAVRVPCTLSSSIPLVTFAVACFRDAL
jgi:hypothetical protein